MSVPLPFELIGPCRVTLRFETPADVSLEGGLDARSTPSPCPRSLRTRRPALLVLVESCGELFRREDPVALGHELMNLLPVGVVGEQDPDAIPAGS